MKNYYNFHSYTDTYTTTLHNGNQHSFELKNNVELSMGFFQLIPKSFEIVDMNYDNTKDIYHLSFHITLQFFLENDGLVLNNFRFSISGTESNALNHRSFSHYPKNKNFTDFIEEEYKTFTLNKHSFISEAKTYNISDKDYQKIQDGLHYIKRIFPNDKDIVILDEPGADFYQSATSGFKDGILLYEKSRTLLYFNTLEQKFPEKENIVKLKTKKI